MAVFVMPRWPLCPWRYLEGERTDEPLEIRELHEPEWRRAREVWERTRRRIRAHLIRWVEWCTGGTDQDLDYARRSLSMHLHGYLAAQQVVFDPELERQRLQRHLGGPVCPSLVARRIGALEALAVLTRAYFSIHERAKDLRARAQAEHARPPGPAPPSPRRTCPEGWDPLRDELPVDDLPMPPRRAPAGLSFENLDF